MRGRNPPFFTQLTFSTANSDCRTSVEVRRAIALQARRDPRGWAPLHAAGWTPHRLSLLNGRGVHPIHVLGRMQ